MSASTTTPAAPAAPKDDAPAKAARPKYSDDVKARSREVSKVIRTGPNDIAAGEQAVKEILKKRRVKLDAANVLALATADDGKPDADVQARAKALRPTLTPKRLALVIQVHAAQLKAAAK